MLKWYRQPDSVNQANEYLNYMFTFIFTSEAIIRISGTGTEHYFKDAWNVFDFIVALGSIVGIVITYNTNLEIKGTSLLRAFRILRLLRLLKRGGKSLYLIFNTFVITMQSLANIGGLLMLIMYIYSIIGMIYFGEVKRNDNMNDYINFESFTSAFITLFTIATVDSWNYTLTAFAY
jgi:Ion transport protein